MILKEQPNIELLVPRFSATGMLIVPPHLLGFMPNWMSLLVFVEMGKTLDHPQVYGLALEINRWAFAERVCCPPHTIESLAHELSTEVGRMFSSAKATGIRPEPAPVSDFAIFQRIVTLNQASGQAVTSQATTGKGCSHSNN